MNFRKEIYAKVGMFAKGEPDTGILLTNINSTRKGGKKQENTDISFLESTFGASVYINDGYICIRAALMEQHTAISLQQIPHTRNLFS